MRGALFFHSKHGSRDRIIPADAGSTRCYGQQARVSKDHPRGCGEHYPNKASEMWFDGSSPRMRGARSCDYFVNVNAGIIPADAGSTVICA